MTLSSFFKRLLLILLGIFNQMIVTTQKAIIKDSERSEGLVELLTRKGVYPYDYVSSVERFSETQLPPKSEFYSRLNDADINLMLITNMHSMYGIHFNARLFVIITISISSLMFSCWQMYLSHLEKPVSDITI